MNALVFCTIPPLFNPLHYDPFIHSFIHSLFKFKAKFNRQQEAKIQLQTWFQISLKPHSTSTTTHLISRWKLQLLCTCAFGFYENNSHWAKYNVCKYPGEVAIGALFKCHLVHLPAALCGAHLSIVVLVAGFIGQTMRFWKRLVKWGLFVQLRNHIA